ncbi:hypothetical protein OAO18_00625 [Francisellaceae bacterium]|nr:hypothetical protein [Francisellaceae bacterium]
MILKTLTRIGLLGLAINSYGMDQPNLKFEPLSGNPTQYTYGYSNGLNQIPVRVTFTWPNRDKEITYDDIKKVFNSLSFNLGKYGFTYAVDDNIDKPCTDNIFNRLINAEDRSPAKFINGSDRLSANIFLGKNDAKWRDQVFKSNAKLCITDSRNPYNLGTYSHPSTNNLLKSNMHTSKTNSSPYCSEVGGGKYSCSYNQTYYLQFDAETDLGSDQIQGSVLYDNKKVNSTTSENIYVTSNTEDTSLANVTFSISPYERSAYYYTISAKVNEVPATILVASSNIAKQGWNDVSTAYYRAAWYGMVFHDSNSDEFDYNRYLFENSSDHDIYTQQIHFGTSGVGANTSKYDGNDAGSIESQVVVGSNPGDLMNDDRCNSNSASLMYIYYNLTDWNNQDNAKPNGGQNIQMCHKWSSQAPKSFVFYIVDAYGNFYNRAHNVTS